MGRTAIGLWCLAIGALLLVAGILLARLRRLEPPTDLQEWPSEWDDNVQWTA